jgi:cell wall-associated NlpC family hydrolase
VSFADVVARVSQIQAMERLLLGPASQPPGQGGVAAGSASNPSFSTVLGSAVTSSAASTAMPAAAVPVAAAAVTTPTPAPAAVPTPVVDVGAKALRVALGEIGQAEQPPGSNDSPRIAVYRSAVQGAVSGQPWCAYFVSWAAAQAGAPLGETGQGFGAVAQIEDWARRTGKLLPAGATPRPGDLILFGTQHVGIVESVASDGTITTVEGNTGDAVRRRSRSPGEATGYVRL